MAYFVQDSVYIPQQLTSDMAGQEALDIMIEGDKQAKGLRFSKVISSISNNRIIFTNQDGQTITYILNSATNKLSRIINGTSAQIPYYAASGVNIAADGRVFFIYYDSNEAITRIAAKVRRIAIKLVASTGTGSFQNWNGKSVLGSSITVPRYQ